MSGEGDGALAPLLGAVLLPEAAGVSTELLLLLAVAGASALLVELAECREWRLFFFFLPSVLAASALGWADVAAWAEASAVIAEASAAAGAAGSLGLAG